MTFSPDGSLLATGGYRSIRIWKKEQPEKKSKIDLPADAKAVSLSRDSSKLAYAGAGNVIKVVDLKEGKPLAEMKGHADAVTSIRFSADGALLLSGSADKTIRVWKTADGSAAGRIETPAAVAVVEWLAEDKQVAGAGADGMIRLWTAPDAATLAEGAAKPAPLKEIKAAAVELRAATGGLLLRSAHGPPAPGYAAGRRATDVFGPTEARRESSWGKRSVHVVPRSARHSRPPGPAWATMPRTRPGRGDAGAAGPPRRRRGRARGSAHQEQWNAHWR
jgi:hypothetical protein